MKRIMCWTFAGLAAVVAFGCSSVVDEPAEEVDDGPMEALVSSLGSGGGSSTGPTCGTPPSGCRRIDEATFASLYEQAQRTPITYDALPPWAPEAPAPCGDKEAKLLLELLKRPKISSKIAAKMWEVFTEGYRGCGAGCSGLLAYCGSLTYPTNDYCAAVVLAIGCL